MRADWGEAKQKGAKEGGRLLFYDLLTVCSLSPALSNVLTARAGLQKAGEQLGSGDSEPTVTESSDPSDRHTGHVPHSPPHRPPRHRAPAQRAAPRR